LSLSVPCPIHFFNFFFPLFFLSMCCKTMDIYSAAVRTTISLVPEI
jgi:hypothetical protein